MVRLIVIVAIAYAVGAMYPGVFNSAKGLIA